MGLRAPSEWSPQKTGNVPGMTPKQESMATARSPLAGQEMNEVKPPKSDTGNVRSQQEQEQAQIGQEQKKQEAASTKTGQAQAVTPTSQAVEAIASKLGNFGYSLRAKVNQFLTAKAQSTGFGESTSTFKNGVLNVQTGAADTGAVVREKQAQQAGIRQALSPFATEVNGKLMAKSFGEAVKDQMGSNPQVASILQTVAALQDLKARGLSGSPEALALEAQVAEQDKFGMVSQLRDAMTSYNNLMGINEAETVKWYGGSTTGADGGKSALDLAELGVDELTTEVKKAQTLSSGLFGGDFEENLQKLIDTESAENKANARKSEQLNSQLYTAFNGFRNSTSEEFGAQRKAIEDRMNLASQGVRAALLLTPEGRESLQWFDALAEGSDGNMVTTLLKALNDKTLGLGQDQKNAIANFIGEVGSATGGQLDLWMQSLGNSGTIPLKNPATGNTEMVEPSATQKLQMLDIMEDTTSTPEQKQAKMQELVRGIGLDSATNIGKSVDEALATARATGNMTMALGAFSTSLVASLQTFAHSRTEDAVRASMQPPISIEEWDKLDHDQRAALIRETFTKNPQLAETVRGQIKAKQTADTKQFNKVIEYNRKTATDTITALDKLENGDVETNTPSLATRKQGLLTAQANLKTNLANKAVEAIRSSETRANTYLGQLLADPTLRSKLQTTPDIFPALAYALSTLEAAQQVGAMYPGIADSFYWGWKTTTPKSLMEVAMGGNPKALVDLANTVKSRMAKSIDSADGKMNPNILASVDSSLASWKTNPQSRPPMAAAIMTALESSDQQIAQLDTIATNITTKRATIAKGLKTMEDMVKDMEIPTFNPTEILDGVLGMARGFENILNGKANMYGLDTSVDNLATIIPGLLNPTTAGDGNTIPDSVKKVLDALGLPVESWTIKNGIPAIRMGNGQYIPVGGEEYTALQTSLGYTPDALPTGVNFEGLGDIGYTGAANVGAWLPVAPEGTGQGTPESQYTPGSQEEPVGPDGQQRTGPSGTPAWTGWTGAPRDYNDNMMDGYDVGDDVAPDWAYSQDSDQGDSDQGDSDQGDSDQGDSDQGDGRGD